MSKKIKIKFDEPRHLPSSIDGIEYLYPFKKITIENEGQPDEKVETENKSIKVSISGSLAAMWGYQIWQTDEHYKDLKKILFAFSFKEIKEKLKDNTLDEYHEILLLTSNQPNECPYNPENIDKTKDYEFAFEGTVKNISNEIAENKLAAEIISHRDNINAIFYQKYKSKLLELDQERNLLDFFRQTKTEEEFSHRLASLTNLVGKLNSKKLLEIIKINTKGIKSIGLLEKYLYSLDERHSKAIKICKAINRLRQCYPIHTDIADGVIDAHRSLHLDYPIINYENSWIVILRQYLDSLKELLKIFKEKLMKKNVT